MPPLSAIQQPIQKLIAFYRDENYFRQLLKFGVPIGFQQAIVSLLNMVAVVMVGQKFITATVDLKDVPLP